MVEHALSFDVENWYDGNLYRSLYTEYVDSRVLFETMRVLEMLSVKGVLATFFIVGRVAAAYPQLVREVAQAGHEVGCHSYDHELIYRMTPRSFLSDLVRSRGVLQDLSAQSVEGFRAPSWSMTAATLTWAPAALAAAGFTYTSSVFPMWTPLYGVPGAPRVPWNHSLPGGGSLPELPPAVKQVGPVRIPYGGGAYWRVWPNWLTARMLKTNPEPVIFYLHPWELSDEPLPIAPGMPLSSRFTLTYNRQGAGNRFVRLLGEIPFGPVARVFSSHIRAEVSA